MLGLFLKTQIKKKNPDYLCFTAEEAGAKIKLQKTGSPTVVQLEISYDRKTWADYTIGNTITLSNVGDKLYFRNKSETDTLFSLSPNSYYKFVITIGNTAASGDVTTLLNKNGTDTLSEYCFYNLFNGATKLTKAPEIPVAFLGDYCCFNMFMGCRALTETPELIAPTAALSCYQAMFKNCSGLINIKKLPATTLRENCYRDMFYSCTSLTEAPELPATTLAANCYRDMFYNCSSLTSTPELPATTLAEGCYNSMFSGCIGLTEAPELPATTLAIDCYHNMFQGCTGLVEAPELSATTLVENCYYGMFYGCTNLTQAPELSVTTLAANCYRDMFYNCSSLTSAPELPATTLADYCYARMFYGCSSLIEVPELPATTLTDSCYWAMFQGCTSLTAAPNLPATTLNVDCYRQMFQGDTSLSTIGYFATATLASGCYMSMFNGCTSLTMLPELPAITLKNNCYNSMFRGCTNIKLSETQTGEYQTEYRIPTEGTGITANNALANMFTGTGGTFVGAPTIDTTYYTSNTIVSFNVNTPGIYHDVNEGLISLSSDGTNWITIADKNVGTTQVYNNGDTLSEANCGKYFQWGNNYGFPRDSSASITTDTNLVDATNYGPYYYSDTFITSNTQPFNWSSVANPNLWGGVTGTYEAQRGPAEVGYHLPTSNEWKNAKDIWESLGGSGSDGTSFSETLKLPFTGYRRSYQIDQLGSQGSYATVSVSYGSCCITMQIKSNKINPSEGDSYGRGYSARAFKNTPVTPDDSWTLLYGISIQSGGIFWNSVDGLISLSSDGNDWITIQDKNIGATQVWNSGDTLSADNCGNYFQWGNNYPFPFDGTCTSSSTLVDASNYGPYYNNNVFITTSASPYNWSSVDNSNLWGGITGTNEARRGPCSEGFHIPTKNEFVTLFNIGAGFGIWTQSHTDVSVVTQKLKLPICGIRETNGNVKHQGSYGYYRMCERTSSQISAGTFCVARPAMGFSWGGERRSKGYCIRPFKNTSVKPNKSWTILYQPSS